MPSNKSRDVEMDRYYYSSCVLSKLNFLGANSGQPVVELLIFQVPA